MKLVAVLVLCTTCLLGGDTSVLQTDQQGAELGALGLRVAAVEGRTSVQVVLQGPERVLVTPAASVVVTRGKVLLARLNPGKTYYFEDEKAAGEDSGQQPQKSQVGKGDGFPAKVKWGIAAGIAAGAGVGLKLGLDKPEPVSRR